MPLLFSDLPPDVVLEVVQYLTLPEPIHLFLTCSSLYSLSTHRSFWISILETTRATSTIACPRHDDLSEHTLESLKHLVFSWLRLQDNWSRPEPRIAQPVTSAALSEPAQIVFTVQGTDILVLYMRESGTLLCWDVEANAPFPLPRIHSSGRITGVSEPCESYGVCSNALLTMSFPFSIAHRHIYPPGAYFESCFVTEDLTGSVVVTDQEDYCTITARSIADDRPSEDHVSSMKMPCEVSGDGHQTFCFTHADHLYIVLEDGASAHIQRIPCGALLSGPPSHAPAHHAVAPLPTLAGTGPHSPFCFILPSTPACGVAAVFVHVLAAPAPPTTCFTFLLADAHPAAPLAFRAGVTALVPGHVFREDMALLWMDHGGAHVVVVMDSRGDGVPALVLVRLDRAKGMAAVHRLMVPEDVDLRGLDGVSVNETAGAVHLIHRNNVLSTLWYV
ncbi:hypothetical protein B0H10DRAFT_1978682 [Mycena sp. CBHHK59/15]|nr:hypothetical protein B0H10DRAFT_1978682 [Mycena sp. CBHHK59/15]